MAGVYKRRVKPLKWLYGAKKGLKWLYVHASANVIFTFIRKNAPGGVWTLAGIYAGVWAGVKRGVKELQ